MPRVKSQIAAKDYPEAGIKKGEKYYSWKFRYGGKHKSKSYPKPQQLTQSDFLQRVYEFNDEIEALEWSGDIKDDVQDLIDRILELRDECEEKRSNMPESLQDSGSGEILQNRYDSLDEMINDLEAVDLDIDLDIDLEDEDLDQISESVMEELHNISYQGE
jgi:hypothetical protein